MHMHNHSQKKMNLSWCKLKTGAFEIKTHDNNCLRKKTFYIK